jgi:hypothetical protein
MAAEGRLTSRTGVIERRNLMGTAATPMQTAGARAITVTAGNGR